MSDKFWEEPEEAGPILCDLIMTPDTGAEVPCMKEAEFTMEDGTVCCKEHKDLLVEADGLDWVPGVPSQES